MQTMRSDGREDGAKKDKDKEEIEKIRVWKLASGVRLRTSYLWRLR